MALPRADAGGGALAAWDSRSRGVSAMEWMEGLQLAAVPDKLRACIRRRRVCRFGTSRAREHDAARRQFYFYRCDRRQLVLDRFVVLNF